MKNFFKNIILSIIFIYLMSIISLEFFILLFSINNFFLTHDKIASFIYRHYGLKL